MLLAGDSQTADDTDRLFSAGTSGVGRRTGPLGQGRTALTGSHDQQCEGLIVLARLVGADAERPPNRAERYRLPLDRR